MILLNGSLIDKKDVAIDMEDRGYQFGDGVYEVIRVYDGVCFELEAHIQRLAKSADELEIAYPFPLVDIEQQLLELVEKTQLENGTIYIQITRGVARRTHHFPENITPTVVAYVQDLIRPLNKMENGSIAILADDIRWKRCDIKSLNLLGNVLIKQKAKGQGYEEAILHRDGIVTEGSSTNVFIVKNDVIYTHPANHLILKGITREIVINIAQESNFPLIQTHFTVDELLDADEVFITSTTLEVIPIIQVDHQKIGEGRPGLITQTIQREYGNKINQEVARIHSS